MSTIRIVRCDKWTTVDKETVNDRRLSWRARGILVWLLDKPDNWETSADRLANELANEGPDGETTVRTALKELEDCGYLRRRKLQDKRGRWSTQLNVDVPIELTKEP